MLNSNSSQLSNLDQTVDLIIIGAGPAGISTALHLLQLDPAWSGRMLVLEKAQHPRHKLCGGGLTYFGVRILKQLGFVFPLPVPHFPIYDLHFRFQHRVFTAHGLPLVTVFQRSVFDEYLVNWARQRGVVVREDEKVTSIIPVEDGVRVETDQGSYRARAVIGADGSKGICRRVVSNGEGTSRTARALEIFQPVLPWDGLGPYPKIVFDFTPILANLQGYFWQIPMGMNGKTYENRGVYDARFYSQKERAALKTVLAERVQNLDDELDQTQIEGHPIHLFSPRNVFSSPRILLVGDAAGVDPLLGEGIGPALGYGKPAARAIQLAFHRNDFSFRNYRRQLLWSPVGRYLLLRYSIARVGYRFSHHTRFMRNFWRAAVLVARFFPKVKV